jgi:hypothetical protein
LKRHILPVIGTMAILWQLLMALSPPASSLAAGHAQGIDLSSPEATIRTFEKAINMKDAAGMAACVDRTETPLEPLAKMLKTDPIGLHITIDTGEVTVDTAKISFWSNVTVQKTGRNITQTPCWETVRLRRRGTQWLFQDADVNTTLNSGDFLGRMVVYARYP